MGIAPYDADVIHTCTRRLKQLQGVLWLRKLPHPRARLLGLVPYIARAYDAKCSLARPVGGGCSHVRGRRNRNSPRVHSQKPHNAHAYVASNIAMLRWLTQLEVAAHVYVAAGTVIPPRIHSQVPRNAHAYVASKIAMFVGSPCEWWPLTPT